MIDRPPTDPRVKIREITELRSLVSEAQRNGRRVVFANGCFDVIHVGHTRYLQGARAQGDMLVVGVNSDESVRALKGKGRPLQNAAERAEIVASFESVDYVLVFDDPTVDRVLLELRPDVHAKGPDYSCDNVPERATVRSYGGSVAIVGDPKEHSSRGMIARILERLQK